jgi:hypothetical protein
MRYAAARGFPHSIYLDDRTREALAIGIDKSLLSTRLVRVSNS